MREPLTSETARPQCTPVAHIATSVLRQRYSRKWEPTGALTRLDAGQVHAFQVAEHVIVLA